MISGFDAFRIDRKRSPEDDEEKKGRWLVTYCSLAITLVAVFMMLVSYSSFTGGKMKKYQKSMGIGDSAGVVRRLADPVESSIEALTSHARQNGYSEKIEAVRTKNGFKAVIAGDFLFPPLSATLRAEATPLLEVITGILKKGFFSAGIAGHTAEVPVRTAEFTSTWELSGMRAVNVMNYLVKSGRIPESRLSAAGFGQYRPAVPEASPLAEGKNDRLEFLFVLQETIEG